jgi:hypothetical protein
MGNMKKEGEYLYVPMSITGLKIIDVSNPALPQLITTYNTFGGTNGVDISEGKAYVTTSDEMLILDISNPVNPQYISSYEPSGGNITVNNDIAFVSGWDQIRLINVSDPENPTHYGYYNTDYCIFRLVVIGDFIYAANNVSFGIYDWTYETGIHQKPQDIKNTCSLLKSISPNPFNSSIVISFELRVASPIDLKIYDISGREVWSMVSPPTGGWSIGEHSVVWDAEGMPSGIYFVNLRYEGRSEIKKAILIK